MLGIQIAGEFLDLPPGTSLEMENSNPFLQFGDEVIGGFSLPFDVLNNTKNNRLLNYAGIFQTKINNTGIDAILWDGGTQLSIGKIKIEKSTINLNRNAASNLSCYFLTDASSFYQDIKDKNLRDINLGGARTFAWDNYAASGPGFSGHITTVINGLAGYGTSGYDFAFYPVVNKGWPGVLLDPDIMNFCFYQGGIVKLGSDQSPYNGRNPNRYVPMPYLKYVLIKAFEYVGWAITGDILDDEFFKKITMINFRTIDWCYVKKQAGSHLLVPHASISYDLADHLPDISIGDFVIAIKKRLGLYYSFNKLTKTITIKKMKVAATGEVKDFTNYAEPVIPKKIKQDKVIYALRNEFATALGDGAPNFKLITLLGNVNMVSNLPAAAESLDGKAYLVIAENNYYICQQNQTTEAWQWIFYAYNIFDYEPAGATDDITTSATTVGVEYYNAYLDLVPRIDNQGEWAGHTDTASWGIHLCFYHGLRNNKSATPYPYASSHVYDSTFTQVADWALSFECFKADGSDVGIYATYWKPLLDILEGAEEMEIIAHLPVTDVRKIDFTDQIVVDGVKMFVKEIKSSLPYKGTVTCNAVRV